MITVGQFRVNRVNEFPMSPTCEFIGAYIEAMIFADGGEEDEPDWDTPISQESQARIVKDCLKFGAKARELILSQIALDESDPDNEPDKTGYNRWQLAGHDFWLSRQGHGAGFWETPDWDKEIGAKLDKLAQSFKNCEPYIGGDGALYFM